jgi:hypothetical protein
MEGRPIVASLQDFVSCPLCCIVTSTGLIMTCMEDVMDFILSHTSSQYLIRPKLEQVSLNPSVGGTFPDDFAVFSIGEMLRKLSLLLNSWLCQQTRGFPLRLQRDAHLESCHLPPHHLQYWLVLIKKYATTFYFLGLSSMVRSNSCNNKIHLIILPLMSVLFIKYLMET